jgi:hypothetical protein
MPILRDKNYQELNDRIRSFTVLSWYCKTFIAHALFRDSDFSTDSEGRNNDPIEMAQGFYNL